MWMKFVVVALLFAFVGGTSNAQKKGPLDGIVDIHAHGGPDFITRRYDELQFVRQAQAAGMRGAILKSHEVPTTQMVALIRKLEPGFQSFGTVVLNRSVGGINPRVVEVQAQIAGHYLKFVYFPTNDAENPEKHAKNLPYVAVSKDGALLPEVYDVLKLIKQYDLVMCTGHVVPKDALLLIHEAKKMGLTKMVATHPANQGTTIAEMQEEANSGAFIEITANQIIPGMQDGTDNILPNPPGHMPEEYIGIIKGVGAEHVILSGDFGRPDFINFLPGWPMAINVLKKLGITDAQIDIMAKKNPADLLGLNDPKPAK
jgi:hypothetical protein